MPTNSTEGNYIGDWLKYELSPDFCREERILTQNNDLVSGTVVAQVKTGVRTIGTNTGNGVATLGAIGPKAITGAYLMTCTAAAANAGTFETETPSGEQLQRDVTVGGGAINVDDHFTITIADGAADFVVGDTFIITISDGKIVPYDDTATDIKKTAVGILVLDAKSEAAADGKCVVLVRGPAKISRDRLTFPSTADATEKAAVYETLKSLNILSVEGV
jgi:hypothetical protein